MLANRYGPPWARLTPQEATAIAQIAAQEAWRELHSPLDLNREGRAFLEHAAHYRLEQLEPGRWCVHATFDMGARTASLQAVECG